MDRFAIFIDAGYFFSAGAFAAQGRPQGQPISRKSISLKNPDKALAELSHIAAAQTGGLSLLRTYWYDATPGSRPSLEQSTIALLPYVKLRLGVLNNVGEQKGVDSLIVTDLIELARNGAIADAVLVSGDEDLRIAVQLAQSFGVRVHVLAAGDPKTNVSSSLQMESDSLHSLPSAWFNEHFVISQPAPAHRAPLVATSPSAGLVSATPVRPVTAQSKVTVMSLDQAAEKVSKELVAGANPPVLASLKQHFTTSNSVPPEYDGRLIAKTAALVGGKKLTGDETRHVRGIFVTIVRAA